MQNTSSPIKDFDDEANLGLFYILSANFSRDRWFYGTSEERINQSE